MKHLIFLFVVLSVGCSKQDPIDGKWYCSRIVNGELEEKVFEDWETQQVTGWHGGCSTFNFVTDCKCERK